MGVWKKSGEKILVMASTSNADPVLSPANHILMIKYKFSSCRQEGSIVQRRCLGLRNPRRLAQQQCILSHVHQAKPLDHQQRQER